MIPAAFDYLAPESLQEALAALAQHGDDAKILAGGQSLLPVLRMRLNAPEVVIDLGKVAALRGIREDGDAIVIGAMTTYADILASDLVRRHLALLAEAVATVADPQIRHRGTLGGSLVHADPAGDVGPAVLALDATLVIAGQGGSVRTVPVGEFFHDMFATAVGEEEILTEIRLPKHTGWGAAYEKFVRVAQQWSIVAVAATVDLTGGSVGGAKVALANMGSTPVRAAGVESALIGQPANADSAAAAAARVGEGTNPPSDLNGDAAYRTHLATVLTRRAVASAFGE
ncbi:MAG: FAD binding domain-containing protein [Nostocoides sp.]